MVGLQVLVLAIGVRVPVPEQVKITLILALFVYTIFGNSDLLGGPYTSKLDAP